MPTTAGDQATKAKINLQIAEGSPAGMKAGDIDPEGAPGATHLQLGGRTASRFCRNYVQSLRRGHEIRSARRWRASVTVPHAGIRAADVSSTLFLTDPADYDGGELVIDDTYGSHSVKLPAGDMIRLSGHQPAHVTPSPRRPLVVVLLDPIDGRGRWPVERCCTTSTLAIMEVRRRLGRPMNARQWR